MPIYEFECPACGNRFEELCGFDARAPCPACGAAETQRLLSQFLQPNRLTHTPGQRRRADAQRQAERERRAESG